MFKLISLKIKDHFRFKDLNIDFIKTKELQNGPYTSLIIGPNGTGKSHVLSIVIEIFNVLAASQKRTSLVQQFKYDFELTYYLNNSNYFVSYHQKVLNIQINNSPSNLSELLLPSKIIASSISLHDRYPTISTRSKIYNDKYEYLGIRSTTNAAYISNHSKSIINSLSVASQKLNGLQNLKVLFDRLDLYPVVDIIYKPGKRFAFAVKGESFQDIIKDKKHFYSYFEKFIERKKKNLSEERRVSKYEKILRDGNRIDSLLEYLTANNKIFEKRYRYQIKINYTLDFTNSESLGKFIKEIEVIKTLLDLELFSIDKIKLKKNKDTFFIEQASSGEYHLLTSFLSIASKIEENSIILIDEPEISLHPNWQMQYMDLLNKIFENYQSCHFIIASHSHFIVSDLKDSLSNIISMKIEKGTGEIYSNVISNNTYSKSAEEILLEIFETPTTRNYYVAELVGEILQLMADPSSENSIIKEKIQKLKELNLENLSINDPLKDIVEKLFEKVS